MATVINVLRRLRPLLLLAALLAEACKQREATPGSKPSDNRSAIIELRKRAEPQPIPGPSNRNFGGRSRSPETTRLVGPLRPDGSVNFLAALREMTGRGVTPQNNAVVLLLQALGPKPIEPEVRERVLQGDRNRSH